MPNALYPQFLYPRFAFDLKADYIDWDFDQEQMKLLMARETAEIQQDEGWKLARDIFNQDEKPFLLSPGELEIFNLILGRSYKRSIVICSTQYGKTLTIARGVLTRISSFAEEWLIIVPDVKRGKILLNYIIKDTAENEYFKKKLIGIKLEERSSMERLMEERSKVKLTFQIIKGGSAKYASIEIISTEARRKTDAINSIMGFGGRNIIDDESSLTDDEVDAGVFRMMAGKGEDTFLVKIGNPFYRNHFLKSWQDPHYKKVWIDYRIGLADGRYNDEFIEEAKQKPKFDVLFECRFPSESAIDTEGWSPLITQTEVENAITDDFNPFGVPALGADPSDAGENESVIVVRWRNVAKIDYASNQIDLLDFSGEIGRSMDAYNVDVRTCSVDKVGVGAMIPAKMKEVGKPIQGVNVGEVCENPEDQIQFVNKRAEFAWRVREWIKGGGKLLRDPRWYQLLNIKYKEDNKRRLRIMSKEDMLKQGIVSPDAFDALALTFARPQIYYTKTLAQDQFDQKMRQMRGALKKKGNKPFKMTGY
jgi:hypothetical protein